MLPFRNDAFIIHFLLPVRLVRDLVHEEKHAPLSDGENSMVPVHDCRQTLCNVVLVGTPVIVREAEARKLQDD